MEFKASLPQRKKNTYLDPILSQLNTIYQHVILGGFPLKYKSLKLSLLFIFSAQIMLHL